jgi:hypothetical protein
MQNSGIEGIVWALEVSTIIKLKNAKKASRKN